MLGDLDIAEGYANEAREINEPLGLTDVIRSYHTLSEIAAARGHTEEAAEWARKRDLMQAEIRRRAGGGSAISLEMKNSLLQLAVACVRGGFGDDPIGSAEEQALATLNGLPEPFPAFSAHLRSLAAGELPPIPAELPTELVEILEQIHNALKA